MTPRPNLAEELQALPTLSRADLAERWGALYSAPPPPRTSRSLILRAVAYKLQENAYGGLSPTLHRMLLSLSSAKPRRRTLRPGTILLREWQAVTHRVTVIEGGAIYRGEKYRSLSEIARLITGARWSGPRFFGLKPDGQA
jgi:hypothetical protein